MSDELLAQGKPEQPIIQVKELRKLFRAGKAGLFWGQEQEVRAVDGVSFSLAPAEVLALVGESGCGKSTLALTLMGLEKPTEGDILFEGISIRDLDAGGLKALRRKIQMVFQDPYESLNPTQTVEEIVLEPLHVHKLGGSAEQQAERVRQALEDVGLVPAENYLRRYPHELSGGQRQRVVIAGALVLEPHVLLADEPVSMLDVSIRAEILHLLRDLERRRGISVIFITHDLGTVAYFADRVAVMYLGRIVEVGPTLEVLQHPLHPYTRALLSVVPVPNPRLRRQRIILQGETPNPINPPSGCRFHPRCPVAEPRCKEQDPPCVRVGEGHEAACLLL
ncbi:MAG: ABC transporter ATP-binding protein [Anaerolineales bacterium]|jgi:oligopeptide/dipeptide ABC transporter ATP-binding protein|nr:ABC transporter ATP-binding protein [Anaerolineales bacterium]